MSGLPHDEARERLTAWLDDVQLSNRLGTPHYANPGELKADLRVLLAREQAEGERAERAEAALVELYRRDAVLVALVCDKLADQSGLLLGRIRDRVNLRACEPGKKTEA